MHSNNVKRRGDPAVFLAECSPSITIAMIGTPRQRRSTPDGEQRQGQMGFLDHLDELRMRIIRSCIAIGAGMVVAFMFAQRIADFVLAPTLRMLPPGTTLIYTRPGEGFSFYLDVALIGRVVLAMPFVTYQVWRFIAPALYANEKRLAVPFVVLATVGSLGGALFTHYVMFPGMIAFFGTFDSRVMKFVPRVEETFDLYKNMMLGMILVFQMPTLVFFLARMRLVSAAYLWRHLQYAILIIFVIAALLTPSTDPWNQAAFAAPMIGLICSASASRGWRGRQNRSPSAATVRPSFGWCSRRRSSIRRGSAASGPQATFRGYPARGRGLPRATEGGAMFGLGAASVCGAARSPGDQPARATRRSFPASPPSVASRVPGTATNTGSANTSPRPPLRSIAHNV